MQLFWETRHIFLFIFYPKWFMLLPFAFIWTKRSPKNETYEIKNAFVHSYLSTQFSNRLFIEFLNDKINIVSFIVTVFITIVTEMHVSLLFIKFRAKWCCFFNVFSSSYFCKQRFFFYIDLVSGCCRHFVLFLSTFQ